MKDIQIGNEYFVQNAAYTKLWGIQIVDDGSSHANIQFNRYSTAGVFQATVATLFGSTGQVKVNNPYRNVASNGALAITSADANGVIHLADSSDAAAKAATITTTGFAAGDTVTICLITRSSTGSYTIAASGDSLTVTLDAAREGCILVFNGTAFVIAALTGGSTAA